MYFYLSSFLLGNKKHELRTRIDQLKSKKFGYISNALDFVRVDQKKRHAHEQSDMHELNKCGAETEQLDLREYFGKSNKLARKLESLGGIFVSGGNTFILRQAYALSGLDMWLKGHSNGEQFIYSAYSAGATVLSPHLKPYKLVDNATEFPYQAIQSQLWKGVGVLDFAFIPHYRSIHPESLRIEKVVKYCQNNNLAYRTFHDGDTLLFDNAV